MDFGMATIRRVSVGSKSVVSPVSPNPVSTPRSSDGLLGGHDSISPETSPQIPQSAPTHTGNRVLTGFLRPPSPSYETVNFYNTAPWDSPPLDTIYEKPAGASRLLDGSYGNGDPGTAGAAAGAATNMRGEMNHGDEAMMGGGVERNREEGEWGYSSEQDTDELMKKYGQMPSDCFSRRDVHMRWNSWLPIVVLILSFYSTGMSLVWLIAAIYQPRWGRTITTGGKLDQAAASWVTALVAKTIETTFVSVFVMFIGQVLTRRAFIKKSKGITIAELAMMRNWVLQPGAMLAQKGAIRHAGSTFLGAVSLAAALAAGFYTTASDAMVSPKLQYGSWQTRVLQDYVRSSYANPYFAEAACKIPTRNMDSIYAGLSCLDVQYSGNSYDNLLAYMSNWTDIINASTPIPNISQRPTATASLYGNTTLRGSWIETEYSDVAAAFKKYGRIVNNVTMAMPHPGVYDAATNPMNGILQPADLDGIGEYQLRASVVSPTINVLCAFMSPQEVEPLVYAKWPNARLVDGIVPGQMVPPLNWTYDVPVVGSENTYINATAVDDIFRWGEKYGRRPPVFPSLPMDYNLVTNSSTLYVDSLYILGKKKYDTNYTLCQLRSWVSPKCSTYFEVSGTAGGRLQSQCEDPTDNFAYWRTNPNADSTPQPDWKNLADEWQLAINLNGGVTSNNASNARILTSLTLNTTTLPPLQATLGEALAVLASSTLLAGTRGTTFQHAWIHEAAAGLAPAPGYLESFPATVRTSEYASTHTQPWQAVFYLVLGLVFAVNAVCFVYFISRRGLVTDFTEPANMFALALNSPPSRRLAGTCGSGPHRDDLVVPWRVGYSSAWNHYFFEEADGSNSRWSSSTVRDEPGRQAEEGGGVRDRTSTQSHRSSYQRLSRSRMWL